ncbi:EndoU domain-containing protein [Flavobacterium sp. DGU11]|uniref:EndoU domain-containing protein n=1 Tax=Flavobacterium arundinis TaxID=3139143 RepID=A0ABU9HY14_9FLAO
MKNKKAITKQLILVNDATEFIRRYTLTTARHLNYGEIRIKKIDPKRTNKDPGWILEEYSYNVSRTGTGGKTPLKKFNYKVTVGGVHNLNNLSRYMRIKGGLKELKLAGKLPTGEKVYKGLVEFWVKELKAWKPKDLASTFFPKSWPEEKIRKVIQEASLNIYFRDRNLYRGITKEGIKIEFRVSPQTGEITTAYITFK